MVTERVLELCSPHGHERLLDKYSSTSHCSIMAYRRCAMLRGPCQDIVAHNGTAVEPILNQSLLRNRVMDVIAKVLVL